MSKTASQPQFVAGELVTGSFVLPPVITDLFAFGQKALEVGQDMKGLPDHAKRIGEAITEGDVPKALKRYGRLQDKLAQLEGDLDDLRVLLTSLGGLLEPITAAPEAEVAPASEA